MVRFHVLTQYAEPLLWVWRDKAADANAAPAYESQYKGRDADGFHLFEAQLDHQLHPPAHVRLHTRDWKKEDCAKDIPRTKEYRFPDDLWMSEGAARVVAENPFAVSGRDTVTVHLITAKKYRGGQLYIWTPGRAGRFVQSSREDEYGPVYDVTLNEAERCLFLFKFVVKHDTYEPDYANRLWVAQDGEEIWAHSQAAAVSTAPPVKKPLLVHVLQTGVQAPPHLHLWQEDSDFATTIEESEPCGNGWVRFTHEIYTGREYRFKLRNPALPSEWESDEARRNVLLDADGGHCTFDGDSSRRNLGKEGVWTLEGDHELFGSQPRADKTICLEIAGRGSGGNLRMPLFLDVWINRARTKLQTGLTADADGCYRFQTYPEVITSFSFHSENAGKQIERYFVKAADDASTLHRYVVLNRADVLSVKPAADLFSNPPFNIERPGVWVADGHLRFAVHCPKAASVEVVGEWTGWEKKSPLLMRSTLDGAYWWAQVPVADVTAALGKPFHGAYYKFRLNQVSLVQDPAADWVESSDPNHASRLVDHQAFSWHSSGWQRPGWEY
ncbi:hypothetical protein VU07_03705, partial [Desulfobulbus sp. F4]|nr:hypothetical protein [Desulfobulbus sp. F4]